MVGKGDVKLCIFYSQMVRGATRGGHHFRDWIDANNASLRSDDRGDTQRGLAGTGGNVQNRVPIANPRIRDKRLRNRRKHLADDFAVLLPVRSGTAPAIDNFLLGLHVQKYSARRMGSDIMPSVSRTGESEVNGRGRAVRDIVLYGLCGGVLIVVLKLTEYRFLVIEHSLEIYGALVATLFAGVGIWLGQTLTRKKPAVVIKEVAVPAQPFVVNEARVKELGITPRELEILGLIAGGLSNREIAERLFVSENTVKTHSSRLFDKLGAKRRTQAVQLGKATLLIP
jgi:DNA-binding CsgD family transcriptional regulator